jgi:hypothetical protein
VINTENTDVFAGNSVDHIIWWCTEELGDDGKLVDVILAGEERLALQHFGEDAARTPDVDLNIVLLPRQHDLGGTVISRGYIAGHLRVLNTGEAKVANLQIAVLVNENVAGLEITVNDASRVHVFETTLWKR